MPQPLGRTPADWRSPSGRFRKPSLGGPSSDFGRRPVVLVVSSDSELLRLLSTELGEVAHDLVHAPGASEVARSASGARAIVLDLRAPLSPGLSTVLETHRPGRRLVAIGEGPWLPLAPDVVLTLPLAPGAVARAVAPTG